MPTETRSLQNMRGTESPMDFDTGENAIRWSDYQKRTQKQQFQSPSSNRPTSSSSSFSSSTFEFKVADPVPEQPSKKRKTNHANTLAILFLTRLRQVVSAKLTDPSFYSHLLHNRLNQR
jgi:hypothetical protein